MNSVMGSLGLYIVGFAPSIIPPCFATRTVEVAAAEDAVFVAAETIDETDDMATGVVLQRCSRSVEAS